MIFKQLKNKSALLSIILNCFFYTYTNGQNVSNNDTLLVPLMKEIVITATRQKESLLKAPVSIEKMNLRSITESAQPGFFDAIQHLKGLQVITTGMGFKVINARGFANPTNVRFVQMVDGVDNQAPHIGAPIANTLGPSDLDILSVEVVPGTASAIYGMNAINGIANFITKDPYRFEGISFSQKTGFNNVGSAETSATLFNETNFRIAKVIKEKWAVKFNGSFMKGTDWFANNRMDLNPNANITTGLIGIVNPGKDIVNMYGDESANRKTLTLGGKQYVISRTGYTEKDVADYGLQNFKSDISVHFRPKSNKEWIYTYRLADQNNIYQRTNRFRFANYLTQQQVLTFKTSSFQLKMYLTSENTGNSYNIRSMAENIDRSFKSDNLWFADFTKRYNSSIQNGFSIYDAMGLARIFADSGRTATSSLALSKKIDTLRQINNWDIGAALKVRAKLFHIDIQHDITKAILPDARLFQVMYGVDFRNYSIIPDGNYFINPEETGKNLNYWKAGGFLQMTKLFFREKVKINGVVRIDKNQYFNPKLNPRLAVVYSPNPIHNFRISVQNGFRFPSIFEAFSNINSGGRKRVGGLPIMSSGIFENSYTQLSITSFQKEVQKDVNINGMNLNDAIVKNTGLLKKNSYTYLQPEQVTGFEAGYRSSLFNGKLNIDVDFYNNIYYNLIAQIDANVPMTQIADSIPFYLQNNTRQSLYRLWTNSKTVSYNFGATFGVEYEVTSKWHLGGNFTYSKLSRKEQSDGLEDAFNTPLWNYNVFVGAQDLFKKIGFQIHYRQQAAFLWQSALAIGNVAGYSTLDAQVNINLSSNALNLKVGATNLLNRYYYSFIGGPAIGGFYYLNVTYSLPFQKKIGK
ncbi:MAG: TonB-dependent receptor [Chitinophagaceae bacterium]